MVYHTSCWSIRSSVLKARKRSTFPCFKWKLGQQCTEMVMSPANALHFTLWSLAKRVSCGVCSNFSRTWSWWSWKPGPSRVPKSSPAKESAAAVSVDESMYIADHSVLAPSAIKRSQDVMAGYGRYQNQSHAGTAKHGKQRCYRTAPRISNFERLGWTRSTDEDFDVYWASVHNVSLLRCGVKNRVTMLLNTLKILKSSRTVKFSAHRVDISCR